MNCVYLNPHHRVRSLPGAPLSLGNVARLIAEPEELERRLGQLPIGDAPAASRFAVVPLAELVRRVQAACPGYDVRVLGTHDVVVEGMRSPSSWTRLLGGAAWVLLLIGAAMAILNFHADVNMAAAHREVYRLLTGRSAERPLVVEVPYAIGVGAGALLFFHRPGGWGRGPGDPSPLEVEMARYDDRIADYWRRHGGVGPASRSGSPDADTEGGSDG